jgi:hypothetical protein
MIKQVRHEATNRSITPPVPAHHHVLQHTGCTALPTTHPAPPAPPTPDGGAQFLLLSIIDSDDLKTALWIFTSTTNGGKQKSLLKKAKEN